MGIGTNITIVVVLMVLILIFYAVFQPVFAGLIDSATGFFTATQLKPRVTEDEIICDLRIKVFADLDTKGFLQEQTFIKIDPQNSHRYNYFECATKSQFSPASLLDFGIRSSNAFQTLDIVTWGGETIHMEIVLRDSSDPTQKVDAFTQPQLFQEIKLSEEFGILKTPLALDTEFVVKNIPLREYNLEIFAGREINDLGAGKPFKAKICDQFSVLSNGVCVRS